MTSFWRLSRCGSEDWEWRYVLFIAFPVFWILLISSKICNDTSYKGWSHYFSKKAVHFKQRKNLKIRQSLLLNNNVIKSNADVIVLITWLMLKFFLSPKMCCTKFKVIWVKQTAFIAVFFTRAKKPLCLSKVWKSIPGIELTEELHLTYKTPA